MFGLFKKKSEVEILQKKFERLMAESHKLSSINRTESDAKFAEANEISLQIAEIQKLA